MGRSPHPTFYGQQPMPRSIVNYFVTLVGIQMKHVNCSTELILHFVNARFTLTAYDELSQATVAV